MIFRAIRTFWQVSASRRGQVFFSFAVMLVASICELFGIGMLVPLLDSISRRGAENFVIRLFQAGFNFLHLPYSFTALILVFAGVMILKYALVAYQEHLSRELNAGIAENFMNQAFAALMQVPLSFYYRQKMGDLVATVFTSARNAGALVENTLLMVKGILFTLMYVVSGFFISVPFTLFICSLSLVAYFIIMPRFKKSMSHGVDEKQLIDDIHSSLFDTLGGIRIVKAFGGEMVQRERFQFLAGSFRRLNVKIMDNTILAHFFFEPLIFTMVVASLLYAVNVLGLPLSSLVVLLFIFVRLAPQAKVVNGHLLQASELLPHHAKVQELIHARAIRDVRDGTRPFAEFQSEIFLRDVAFSYSDDMTPVLNQVNFSIRRGQMVAIVGHSGGGKSTLIDLLLRHHDPTHGELLVDGINLRELQISSWRRHIGIVEQDSYLFNDTVRANILYGNHLADDEALMRAATLAHAHEFISRLPSGYETRVGNRGMTLSGGQKQRIGLARALIRNPDILILDEATSALDSESEKMIQQAIATLRHEKTMIVIAHRLSTIVGADSIIFLDRGRVIEQGTHAELMSRAGPYQRFYHLQSGVPSLLVATGTAP